MSVDVSLFGAIGTNFLNDTFTQAKQSITISELLNQSDGQGGYTKLWVTLGVVDGFMFQDVADEPIEAGRKVTHNRVKIHIQPFAGLKANMKLTVNGDDYFIIGINDIANIGQWYVITAEKGVKE